MRQRLISQIKRSRKVGFRSRGKHILTSRRNKGRRRLSPIYRRAK